jgi:hypothetical protein
MRPTTDFLNTLCVYGYIMTTLNTPVILRCHEYDVKHDPDHFDRSRPIVFYNNTVIYSVNNTTYIGNQYYY